jgi:hypothetical protein
MNVGRTGSSEAVYFELAAPAQRRLRGRAKAPCTVSRAARVIPCSKLPMIAVETSDLSVRVGVIRNRVEPAAIGAMSAMHRR